MAEMRISRAASYLGANHSVAFVNGFDNGGSSIGLKKPASRSCFQICRLTKKRFAGHNVDIDPLFELIPKFVFKGALRSVFLSYTVLFGCELVSYGLCGGLL